MRDDELEIADDFSGLIADHQQADGEAEHIGMVVGVRAKDSAEIEEWERIYLERLMSTDLNDVVLQVIPFFCDGEDLCDPPSKTDAKDLMGRFGLSVREYQELMRPDHDNRT